MKKILALCIILAAGLTTAMAAGSKTTINRMVLKAAQQFDNIVVSGDVTVELRYNTERDGYIVYHYDKNAQHNIKCHNEGSTLVVNGSADAVMTRIVVFYGNELKSIVHNGNARLVARYVKCDANDFDIVVNGNGDIKFGRVKCDNLDAVVNSSGSLSIKSPKVKTCNAITNSSGEISLGERPQEINIVSNGSGNVHLEEGR